MNPDWVAALDIWIPTWKRFDEAETERIARRDHAIRRRTTRGQWRSTGVQDDMFRRSLSHSPETELIALRRSYLDGIRAEAAENTADTTDGGVPFGSPSPPAPMSVRLPPGYENMFSAIQSTAQPSPPTQASLPAQASTQAQISTPLTFVPFTSTEEFIQEADSARIPTPNTDTQAEPVIPTVEPAFEDNVSDFQDSQDLEPADVVRMKEDLRQEMRAEWRLELERSRAALEEKLDSVQKTQEMILEMLRQGHT